MQNSSQLRDESAASALRVFAGNGFGDAAIGRIEPHEFLFSVELYHRARATRSNHLRQIAKAALQAVGDFARQTVTRWKHRQYARATYTTLCALDPHVLRDLGLHRSELMSVAAEVAGMTESTRARLLPIRHNGRA